MILFRGMRFALGCALLVFVGLLDWMTGPNFDFSLFYLVPVCFVAWYCGSPYGYAMSIASAAMWLFVDRLTGARAAAQLLVEWHLLMRLVFFSITVALLGAWKTSEQRLSAMVEQRTAALRRLAAQLSAAEDGERRKLAYDVHDALSQTLSLVRINLDEAQLAANGQPDVQRKLSICGGMIDDVIKQTRTLMFDLYPAMLDDLGLVPTLEWYARDLQQRSGAEIAVSENGARQTLAPTLTNYLFRAIKELIANAIRHGRAREIVVVLHWEGPLLRLVVDDDGSGFDAKLVRSPETRRGLGLTGIGERLTSMGGRLDIESTLREGTRVIVEVPIAPSGATAEGRHHALATAAG